MVYAYPPVEGLDAGISDVVNALRANGFETTDSGDGTSTIECALGFPHVVCVTSEDVLIEEGRRLWKLVTQLCGKRRLPANWDIECHYSPNSQTATITLWGITNEHIKTEANSDNNAVLTLQNAESVVEILRELKPAALIGMRSVTIKKDGVVVDLRAQEPPEKPNEADR